MAQTLHALEMSITLSLYVLHVYYYGSLWQLKLK